MAQTLGRAVRPRLRAIRRIASGLSLIYSTVTVLARLRGLPVDQPRNLAKTVTVE